MLFNKEEQDLLDRCKQHTKDMYQCIANLMESCQYFTENPFNPEKETFDEWIENSFYRQELKDKNYQA